jgi:hypothetical protein
MFSGSSVAAKDHSTRWTARAESVMSCPKPAIVLQPAITSSAPIMDNATINRPTIYTIP